MHAVKLFFTQENVVQIDYVIPNKIMNAYFGKSVKRHQNVFQIITNTIKDNLLAGSQQKAFSELTQVLEKAAS
jgi:hypothetical protein